MVTLDVGFPLPTRRRAWESYLEFTKGVRDHFGNHSLFYPLGRLHFRGERGVREGPGEFEDDKSGEVERQLSTIYHQTWNFTHWHDPELSKTKASLLQVQVSLFRTAVRRLSREVQSGKAHREGNDALQ